MTTNEIIMAVLAAMNLLLVVLAWRRTMRNDTTADAADAEQQRADLRYLMRGVDDIRVDMRALRDELSGLDRRVVLVEASAKSAHKRLDDHLAEARNDRNDH